jgi:putative phosphoribosyl transferase
MERRFRNRRDAGIRLVARLAGERSADSLVLALPRGGVPVAAEVASALGCPLDVFIVRKLGVPGHEELAMGAIASGGTRVVNEDVVELLGIGEPVLEQVAAREQRELERRERVYRGDRPLGPVAGRRVVLVDDGIATGATMLAAVRALRALGAGRIVVAVPVAARSVAAKLRAEADAVVCAVESDWLNGISAWYDDFEQTTDAEVHALLSGDSGSRGAGVPPDTGGGAATRVAAELVELEAAGVRLVADLAVPVPCRGVVVFAHGSGSGRSSPRNRQVAEALWGSGLATLLADLLTPDEEAIDVRTRHLRFDIGLLSTRLVAIVDWIGLDARLSSLGLGCYGASTGAAAALIAAARRPHRVDAVVSRGGRPDLAREALRLVRCPTLLITGGLDFEVAELNRDAFAALQCEKAMETVPGASHLFEEPGALAAAAGFARQWFERHLRVPPGYGAGGDGNERGRGDT